MPVPMGASPCVVARRSLLCALVLVLLWGAGVADAATRYVSPSGSDGAACSALAPCRSFDYAYRQAAPGDLVEVAGGTYGSQTVPALGRTGPVIEFRPALGASVVLGGLQVRADFVTMRGREDRYRQCRQRQCE